MGRYLLWGLNYCVWIMISWSENLCGKWLWGKTSFLWGNTYFLWGKINVGPSFYQGKLFFWGLIIVAPKQFLWVETHFCLWGKINVWRPVEGNSRSPFCCLCLNHYSLKRIFFSWKIFALSSASNIYLWHWMWCIKAMNEISVFVRLYVKWIKHS